MFRVLQVLSLLWAAGADVVTVSDTKRLKQLQRDYSAMLNLCASQQSKDRRFLAATAQYCCPFSLPQGACRGAQAAYCARRKSTDTRDVMLQENIKVGWPCACCCTEASGGSRATASV